MSASCASPLSHDGHGDGGDGDVVHGLCLSGASGPSTLISTVILRTCCEYFEIPLHAQIETRSDPIGASLEWVGKREMRAPRPRASVLRLEKLHASLLPASCQLLSRSDTDDG
jgi:hypothetical protein